MQIIKTDWLNHEGQPIYSLDVQRGDSRLVTGGQSSNGSGLVIIWNFKPIIDAQIDKDENVHKILCRLENHTACVNCVRWSENGKFLATASSDQTIMIWQYAGLNALTSIDNNRSTSTSGSTGLKANRENWKCTQVLNGHRGDVLHLAWSPADKYLASSSIDNTAIVWNVKKFPKRTAILEGHTGFVKGVSWDPAFKYLATQSDDKSLRVWSTVDWSCISVVKRPFKESGSSTHFLRLDWCPDGTAFTAVHSLNNGGPVVKLITRDKWTYDNELVGHRKAVTCTRFSPTLYNLDGSSKVSTYCAAGSKDKSLSVWSTVYSRAVVGIHDLFSGNVMDLAWSPNSAMYLLACSDDGTVAALAFTVGELGKPMNQNQKMAHLTKLYGELHFENGPTENNNVINFCGDDENSLDNIIIDEPRILILARQKAEKRQALLKIDNQAKADSIPVVQNQSKQIEYLAKDGKRRIQPVFLGASTVVEDPALQETDKAMGETATVIQQSPTVTQEQVPTVSQLAHSVSQQSPTVTQQAATVIQSPEKSVPVVAAPSEPLPTLPKQTEKSASEFPSLTVAAKKPIRPKKRRPIAIESDDDEEINEESDVATVILKVPEEPRIGPIIETRLQQPKLAIPGAKKSISFKLSNPNTSLQPEFLCENEPKMNASCITCIKNNNRVWRTVVSGIVTNMVANSSLLFVSIENGCLLMMSNSTGQLQSPYLSLDGQAVEMRTDEKALILVTVEVTVYVWELVPKIRLRYERSLKHVLKDSSQSRIRYIGVTETLQPIVSMPNSCSYVFSDTWNSWLVIDDAKDPLLSTSQIRTPHPGHQGNMLKLPNIMEQESATVTHTVFQMEQLNNGNECKALATVSQIERRIQLSLALDCRSDYEHWLIQYASDLSRHNNLFKVRSLCQSLFDELFKMEKLDKPKLDFANRVLDIVGNSPKLQQVYKEFKEQFDALQRNDLDFL